MATAHFGSRGIEVARELLKAQGQGLDLIQGGGVEYIEHPWPCQFTLVWENHGYGGLKTTNSMATENALIFQYPANYTFRPITLTDSSTKTKTLVLVLQTGTIQSDTIKFLREIVINLYIQG